MTLLGLDDQMSAERAREIGLVFEIVTGDALPLRGTRNAPASPPVDGRPAAPRQLREAVLAGA
jgi:hypothetical protein